MTVARILSGSALMLHLLLPIAVLAAAPAELSPGAPQAGTFSVQIAPQPLTSALIELSRAMDLSIIFDKRTTQGLESGELIGRFRPSDAIAQILAGTGLEFELLKGEIYSIRPGPGGRQGRTVAMTGERVAVRQGRLTDVASFAMGGALEEVSVVGHYITGSRIRRSEELGSAPVDVLSLDDIQVTGAQNLSSLFKYLPAVIGNSTSTSISNGGDGTATVTLRGLPASHTLVLINGRRTANDGLAGESTDLNSIPLAAVERIEVLKDGASAIYGSDAIAGVVNIITKRDYDGLQIESFYGETSRSDLRTRNLEITWGEVFPENRGYILVGGSFFEQGSILSRDRHVSRSADDRPKGGIDKRSSATPNARVTVADTTWTLKEGNGYDGTLASHFRPATDEDRYNFRERTTATVPFSQRSLFIGAQRDLTHRLSGYLEAYYSDTEAINHLAAVPLFTGFEEVEIVVSASNAYNPFGADISDLRRRLVELGRREQINRAWAKRLVTGMEVEFDRVTLDVSLNLNRTDATEELRNIVKAEHLVRAVGDAGNCQGLAIDGCEPVNLFGPAGSIDALQLAYLRHAEHVSGYSELRSFALDLTSELAHLPAGYLEFATGLEYRWESASKHPDRLTAAGLTIGGVNFQPTEGSRNIAALYGELVIPVVDDNEWGKSMLLELAFRSSHYSDFGTTHNPRFGFRYMPTDSLLLRGSYAEGFRAPTIEQLYGGLYQSFDMLTDPCASAERLWMHPGCLKQSDPTLIQFLTIKGGNRSLEPEESINFSIGVVWSPWFLQNLTGSFDFYRIKQREVVNSSAQFLLNRNAAGRGYRDRVIRDENGNVRQIIATHINIGSRFLTGYDLSLRYGIPTLELGTFTVAFNAARIINYIDQVDPAVWPRNLAGTFSDEASEGQGSIPKWKANLGLMWQRGRWESSYTVHFVDKLTEEIPSVGLKRSIGTWLIHDTQVNYRAPDIGFEFTLGVDNLFDREPPFSAAAFNDSYDARTYELSGRFYYGEVAVSF